MAPVYLALQQEPVQGGVEEEPVAGHVTDVEEHVLVVGWTMLEHSMVNVGLRAKLLTLERTFQLYGVKIS